MCIPTERNAKLYADATIEPPASSTDPLTNKPEWQRKWPSIAKGAYLQRGRKEFEQYVLNYYRTITDVDDSIGQLVDTLKATGQYDNTIFIYTSDNGYYIGDHGLWDKRSAYDESLRIPLLVRFPGVVEPGRVIDEMILNIDLAPTLLDIAGAPIPANMQGKSFRALLEGRRTTWRDEFFYQYFAEKPYPETPSMVAVRTNGWKYVEYPADIPELYDLANDPTELTNLAADPRCADRLANMKKRLERLKIETGYSEAG